MMFQDKLDKIYLTYLTDNLNNLNNIFVSPFDKEQYNFQANTFHWTITGLHFDKGPLRMWEQYLPWSCILYLPSLQI